MTHERFLFKRLDVIGHLDAEEDRAFLATCFVDTGELAVLRDASDARRLVLGRSGAGKTALLQQLIAAEERAIVIKPESLALSYISNSTILNFVSQLGVKLDIFFRLLWRHVFTVEILKAHFQLHSEAAKVGFFQNLGKIFRDQKHNQALAYLEKWGKSFWEDTDYRIKEVTTTLERNLGATLGAATLGVPISVEGARRLTEEQKQDVSQRAQTVVNQVQIRELSDVIGLLDAVLKDPQKRYFLVIDRLDENWVEDKVRYQLNSSSDRDGAGLPVCAPREDSCCSSCGPPRTRLSSNTRRRISGGKVRGHVPSPYVVAGATHRSPRYARALPRPQAI